MGLDSDHVQARHACSTTAPDQLVMHVIRPDPGVPHSVASEALQV